MFLLLSTSLVVLLIFAPTVVVSSAAAAAGPSRSHSPPPPSNRRPTGPLFRPLSIPLPTVPLPTSTSSLLSSSFNESLSMDLLFHSSAAYVSDPSRCTSRNRPSFNLTHTFNSSLYGTSLFGYAGVDESQQSIVFAFQGSMDVEQLWEELMHDQPVNETVGSDLLVNQYFYVGSVGLLPAVTAAYYELTGCYNNYTVYFTGHSLGGALAHVLSYLLTATTPPPPPPSSAQPLTLYTFGQPRTGNAAFAAMSSLYVPLHYRVVHWRDAIPHLPPCPTQRGPDGQEVCSSDNSTAGYYAYHAPQEVWYTSVMPKLYTPQLQQQTAAPPPPPPPSPAWIACTGEPVGEDETCSDGLDWWWLSDHYYYYQIEVGDFCTSGREEGRLPPPERRQQQTE